MHFIKRLLGKWTVEARSSAPDLTETFEIDNRISEFMTQFSLWEDVEVVAEAKFLTDKERAAMNRQQFGDGGGGKVLTDKERQQSLKNSGGGGKLLSDRERAAQNKGSGGGRILTDKERASLQTPQKNAPPVSKLSDKAPPAPKLDLPAGTNVRLKSEVQRRLDKFYQGVMSDNSAGEKEDSLVQSITKEVHEAIKTVAKRLKIEPRGIQVKVSFTDAHNNLYGKIKISYKGEEETIEPESLSYNYGYHYDGDDFDGAQDSIWFTNPESPFESRAYRDAYVEIQKWNAADSIFADRDDREIEEAVEKLLLQYQREVS